VLQENGSDPFIAAALALRAALTPYGDAASPKLIALTGWGQEQDRGRALSDPQAVHELIVKSCRETSM